MLSRKQINMRAVKISAALFLIVVICFSSGYYVAAQTALSTVTISGGPYPGAPSYTIFPENGMYYAKDANGAISWSSTNASYTINSATALGGKTFIKDGTYSLDSPILYYDNSQIIGESWNTILELQNAKNVPVIAGSGSFIGDNSGNENVFICNLQIDGNAAGQSTDWVPNGIEYTGLINGVFDKLYIHDCYAFGLCDYGSTYVRQAQNIVLKNSNITDCLEGITFTDVKGLFVQACFFADITLGCGVHGEGSDASDNLEDIHVSDCTFYNCAGAVEVATLDTNYGYGVYVEGNKIYNCSRGVTLYYVKQYHISDNSFRDVGTAITEDPLHYYRRPIGLRNSDIGTIIGNTFLECDQTEDIFAYACNRATVANNVFYTYTTDYNVTKLTDSTRFIISDNSMQHGVSGKYAVVESGTSDYNTIQNNYCSALGMDIIGANTKIKFNIGYTTEKSGVATNLTDGATIASGLSKTITSFSLTSGNNSAVIIVGGIISGTNIVVELHDVNGTAVSGQSVYWSAVAH